MKRYAWAGTNSEKIDPSLEENPTIPLSLWMALLMFIWLHVPTAIQRETPIFAAYREEVTNTITTDSMANLLKVAQETLNSGLTPVLGLKTHPLINEDGVIERKESQLGE